LQNANNSHVALYTASSDHSIRAFDTNGGVTWAEVNAHGLVVVIATVIDCDWLWQLMYWCGLMIDLQLIVYMEFLIIFLQAETIKDVSRFEIIFWLCDLNFGVYFVLLDVGCSTA